MNKMNVKIVLIGITAERIGFKNLSKWDSILFSIDKEPLSLTNLSETNFDGVHLSNEALRKIFEERVSGNYDLIIGITDRKLDNLFFTQGITDNSFVISYFEFENELLNSNIPIRNFILRFIYPMCLMYINNQNKLPKSGSTLIHNDSQRCIFDFMKYKSDVMNTLIKPIISDYSKSKFTIAFPTGFIEKIEKELKKLNILRYHRIEKWVKSRPIRSLIITGVLGLLLNLLANAIWNLVSK